MPPKPTKGRVTLERALSKLGLLSRTEARIQIELGAIKVHGVVETNPLRMVNPDTAHVEFSGQKVKRSASQLFLFHKPSRVVTTKRDPEGRKTIYDFLPEELKSFHAVGRLDMHTTGLLLITNDTQLSNFLTDPENKILRVYIAKVRGEVLPASLEKMKAGVTEGDQLLKAESIEILKASGRESKLKLTLAEGKNREVRRLCGAMGHEVIELKRISFGPFELGDLREGEVLESQINRIDLIILTP